MKNYSIAKVLCGAVIGIAAGVSMAASADGYGETYVSTTAEGLRTVNVSYADLDLTHATGRDTLEHRISQAAKKVCGSSNLRVAGSLRQASENKSCYRDTMAQSLSQVSAPQIAAIGE